ncbi:MAG: HlyD family secretion protein [Rhizomicrobium sp.]|jgi:membrane fusion protein (multidrug efflux system)
MTATFDATATTAVAPARTRRLPLRAIVVGIAGFAAIVAGGFWIASPGSSVSTDDAYIKADSTIIAPKVQGLIAAVLVRDNQRVSAGQPLIRIDPEDYRQALSAAEADVANAQAALAQQPAQESLAHANTLAAAAAIRSSDAERVRATAERTRYETLVASGSVSHSQADTVRATALSANADTDKSRASYVAAQQQERVVLQTRAQLAAALEKAQANLVQARLNLLHTIIRAPEAGVVGDRQAQIGEYVQPGTQLMTVVPMNTIYVAANFKETQTSRMLAGQHARVDIDALPGQTFDGEVESFSPGSGSEFSLLPFEPATGNFTRIVQRVPVRIRLFPGQPGSERLRPGLSADVTVDLAAKR